MERMWRDPSVRKSHPAGVQVERTGVTCDVLLTLTLDVPTLVSGKRVGSGACIGLGKASTLLTSKYVIVCDSEALDLYCNGPDRSASVAMHDTRGLCHSRISHILHGARVS
jgi:hypothetical protein